MMKHDEIDSQSAHAPDEWERVALAGVDIKAHVDALSPELRAINEALDSYVSGSNADARRPDISRLPDALVSTDGIAVPLFNVGDTIIIERRASILPGRPWLDTQAYKVQDIDDETGDLRLWNDALKQFALSNYKTAPARGDVFKLPASARTLTAIGKKKRGRPRKNPVDAPKPPAGDEAVKKGRGRPKGSKNRPKDVIRAERAAKAAERSARKGKR